MGAFLSSGIDSSYIVSLLKPNNTFTVGFENLGFNEIDSAKHLSEILKIENKNEDNETIFVPYEIIYRESTQN